MDELELKDIGKYQVWFRKDKTNSYSCIIKPVELERMMLKN
jgi:hypothetical protein